MPSIESQPVVHRNETLVVRDFNEVRLNVAHRFFKDPSYTAFDAMFEMSMSSEEYVTELASSYPASALWVGGSLGRREMLPNSDMDLFVIYDEANHTQNDISVKGVDKFEIGHIDKTKLADLLKSSFVDANRFIDGRRIGSIPLPDVEKAIYDVNTPDRQLANNISEYFYYRYFDFPQKTTAMGPNLKYSAGSSRDTIFFNMISRMDTGQFPANRSEKPELAEALEHAELYYGIRPPANAVNLMFTVKNAAISVYDATNNPGNKYVSHSSLESIYNFCKTKLEALGYKDAGQFINGYMAARREIELAVDTLFTRAINKHPASEGLAKVLSRPKENLVRHLIDEIDNEDSEFPQSVIAFNAWMIMRNGASSDDMDKLAEEMTKHSIDRVWGGLMAVVCSRNTPDSTLSKLTDWLLENEKGAYLLKLITRNPSASQETRIKALNFYRKKEIVL